MERNLNQGDRRCWFLFLWWRIVSIWAEGRRSAGLVEGDIGRDDVEQEARSRRQL